ncbi:MAG: hypothetical protein GXO79_01555 [Chlorobi bacterium]|nr:hypothetical protein [Chlorobiota bacterium]
MKKLYFLIFTVSLFYFNSCDYINPPEKIPTYIQIDTVLITNDIISHNISDVWVNIDGIALGTFELPALFPVLAENGQVLQIRAGIKNNGYTENRIYYPFYSTFSVNLTYNEAETIKITPEFSYIESTKIIWNEDFEETLHPGHSIAKTAKSDVDITVTNSQFFSGEKCGQIIIQGENNIFEGKSIDSWNLPRDGTPVYLELNYKNNNEFVVGVFANSLYITNQQPVLTVYASDTWNKIYIELTPVLQNFQTAFNFEIYFGILKRDDVTRAEIYFDNIKLIYLDEN